MANVTAGSYLGSQAEDPTADIRKIFSERGNHQDALGTILGYCQQESGFGVGSTDTTGFMEKLDEFRGVVDKVAVTVNSPMGTKDQLVQQINDFLAQLPDKSKVDKFAAGLSGFFNSTIVHFCIELQGESLNLYIPKIIMQGTTSSAMAVCMFGTWAVNREEMIRRADELVVKTKLKERIEDWTRGISSDGYK
ncbi:hypothetical protein BGX28_003884 [Mortierella sp. GBA30]|nr:hypothetical protein BGX28_003884 [Mortierella sp. GBA30]